MTPVSRPMVKMDRPMMTRFLRKIDRDPSTDCWVWTGSLGTHGYGQFGAGQRSANGHKIASFAYRLAYETWIGPVPEGLVLDHLCRNRACVNPDHLEPVTSAENQRRGKALITHCPQGHEYTEENTYVHQRVRGGRHCKTCLRERNRTRWDAFKAARDGESTSHEQLAL